MRRWMVLDCELRRWYCRLCRIGVKGFVEMKLAGLSEMWLMLASEGTSRRFARSKTWQKAVSGASLSGDGFVGCERSGSAAQTYNQPREWQSKRRFRMLRANYIPQAPTQSTHLWTPPHPTVHTATQSSSSPAPLYPHSSPSAHPSRSPHPQAQPVPAALSPTARRHPRYAARALARAPRRRSSAAARPRSRSSRSLL